MTRCNRQLLRNLSKQALNLLNTCIYPDGVNKLMVSYRSNFRQNLINSKLNKCHVISKRDGHFGNRIINAWNLLPGYIVTFPSTDLPNLISRCSGVFNICCINLYFRAPVSAVLCPVDSFARLLRYILLFCIANICFYLI